MGKFPLIVDNAIYVTPIHRTTGKFLIKRIWSQSPDDQKYSEFHPRDRHNQYIQRFETVAQLIEYLMFCWCQSHRSGDLRSQSLLCNMKGTYTHIRNFLELSNLELRAVHIQVFGQEGQVGAYLVLPRILPLCQKWRLGYLDSRPLNGIRRFILYEYDTDLEMYLLSTT